MTGRRRRAGLLIGLALLLGGLAASDVARREAAVDARLAPLIDVVVARADLEAGATLRLGDLGVRRMPLRFAPVGSAAEPAEVVGRTVSVPVPRGGFVAAGQLDTGESPGGATAGVRRGERAAEVVGVGSPELVQAGTRIDVLVTRGEGPGGAAGATELALEDVEVLSSAVGAGPGDEQGSGAPRVAATLRVTLRQAVYLAAAQSFAREVRFLPRPPGDRRRAGAMTVRADMR